MVVPDFINQYESTYVKIRGCSWIDIYRTETIAYLYEEMMITNVIVLINITVFILQLACAQSVAC